MQSICCLPPKWHCKTHTTRLSTDVVLILNKVFVQQSMSIEVHWMMNNSSTPDLQQGIVSREDSVMNISMGTLKKTIFCIYFIDLLITGEWGNVSKQQITQICDGWSLTNIFCIGININKTSMMTQHVQGAGENWIKFKFCLKGKILQILLLYDNVSMKEEDGCKSFKT